MERYQGLGVEVLMGEAKVLDPWRVQITDAQGNQQVLSARNLVLATGASPRVPEIPGLQAVGFGPAKPSGTTSASAAKCRGVC